MSFLVGIDSGGTHIVAQVLDMDGSVRKTFTGGQGNILISFSDTAENLTKIISKIGKTFSLSECTAVVIGVAGLDTAGTAPQLREQLAQHFNVPIILMSDATLAVWNILSGKSGVLALAGTGSAVFSRFGNRTDRVGGWGYLIGDEGSAFDIARRTLRMLADSYDRQDDTSFMHAFLRKSGCSEFPELAASIYRTDRKGIAKLAMITAELSSSYSEAERIIEDAAQSLGRQVILILSRYPAQTNPVVGESGTVLQRNLTYRTAFESFVSDVFPSAEFTTSDRNNASGVFYWYQSNQGGKEI
ncbi:BadF/BadG/BcrA/BcrD ATPase family protein [Lacticaseibacillus hegangensis]|uniref:BadF/BadG/BcrA/BcrD ATPase family protein n=1 Tax=Lacticaseibacillus hegangensis TaxID=2486010 RepID=A0ABW4CZM4_9LACO|nr:BadF/BadG/BcrA/BcrD ATPase family protein [Lacticaseibacillus hegangensis]